MIPILLDYPSQLTPHSSIAHILEKWDLSSANDAYNKFVQASIVSSMDSHILEF